MENKFNVNDWLTDSEKTIQKEIPSRVPGTGINDYTPSTVEQDIDRIVDQIEKQQIDLTSDYKDWLTIGFAFAGELGEMGRSYFHRLSRFYSNYKPAETDRQFDHCLKSKSGTVTIKSFFYLAKQANINIGSDLPARLPMTNPEIKKNDKPAEKDPDPESYRDEFISDESGKFSTPFLPEKVYDDLPKLLTDCCNLFREGIERDIVLLSSMTILSGCLPNIQGTYFNKNLSAHLYLFITGPSASGKGCMTWSRYLAQAIHEEMYISSCQLHEIYLKELEAYENLPKNQKKAMEKPILPFRKMLFLPANSSSAALTQLLAENNFTGIIFESEADTLSNTAKQDWGDSSDIFRKAFHHENTSMARRLNKEIIEITNPHLCICLSGTPKQVLNLMPEVENGLFSRFMYYAFEDTRGFLNPFASYSSENYENYFTKKGFEVHHLYNKLKKLKEPIPFKLTDKQAEKFTSTFQKLLEKNKMLLSQDLDANTKRLGVITFRIAMVITALRLMEHTIGKAYPQCLVCSDQDFDTALTLATTLEKHAVAVYQQMTRHTMRGKLLLFYEKLPDHFDRKKYLAVAAEIGLNLRTADKYMAYFTRKLLTHEYNEYTKILNSK